VYWSLSWSSWKTINLLLYNSSVRPGQRLFYRHYLSSEFFLCAGYRFRNFTRLLQKAAIKFTNYVWTFSVFNDWKISCDRRSVGRNSAIHLTYTWSLRKLLLSGGFSSWKPLYGVPFGTILRLSCSVFFFFRYHAVTGDVLTSIKRTEDSLMRLKRSRKQPGSGASGQALNQENASAMSDDDKIRLQFTLDTEEFGRAVRNYIEDTGSKLFQNYCSWVSLNHIWWCIASY